MVADSLSPLARVVLDVLRIAPGTVDDLSAETKLPPAVMDAALVNAARAVEVKPGTFIGR